MRKINKAGLDLIKSFEKCVLQSYQDSGGVWTVGWGHTGPEVTEGMTYTKAQADAQLEKDLEHTYFLEHYLTVDLADNQYSALVCFTFNIGLGALRTSTLLKKINLGELPGDEWLKWSHVNGIVLPGLLKRRIAELELYNAV